MELNAEILLAKACIVARKKGSFSSDLSDGGKVRMFCKEERFVCVATDCYGHDTDQYMVPRKNLALSEVEESCKIFLAETLRKPDRNAVIPLRPLPKRMVTGGNSFRD